MPWVWRKTYKPLGKNILRIIPLLNVALLFRDGYDYDGYKLRVEFPRGGGGSFRGSRDGGGRSSRFGGGSSRGNPARRSQHRVKVTGIIYTGKWMNKRSDFDLHSSFNKLIKGLHSQSSAFPRGLVRIYFSKKVSGDGVFVLNWKKIIFDIHGTVIMSRFQKGFEFYTWLSLLMSSLLRIMNI